MLVTGRRGELGIKRILSPGGGASAGPGLAPPELVTSHLIVRRCLRVLFHVQHVEDFSDENVNLFPIVPTKDKRFLYIKIEDWCKNLNLNFDGPDPFLDLYFAFKSCFYRVFQGFWTKE